MPNYLDFEEPIRGLEEQLEKQREIAQASDIDMSKPEKDLLKKII